MLSRTNYRPIKPLILLTYLKDYPEQDVILSAQMRPGAFFETTNEKDKFAYLGRFPPNFRGNSASVADINDFAFALTYSPAPCIHGYWEVLCSDAITFVTDPRQGTIQNSKIYATIGDFNRSPLYFTIGKRSISFGQMYTVNPFTAPVTWHYFGALHDGCSVGYYDSGLYLEATAMNGGRGIRVADTNHRGKLDNWAINGRYQICSSEGSIALGGGYLHSTIYDGPEAEH